MSETPSFMGAPKTRVVVSGEILSLERVDTEWGNSTRIKIRDAEGRHLRWLSSNGEYLYELQVGQPVTIRATIKKYVTDEGRSWVVLTNGRLETDALALI